jgi:hypothetical protein
MVVSEVHEFWSGFEEPSQSSSSFLEVGPQDKITTTQDLLYQLEEVGLIL